MDGSIQSGLKFEFGIGYKFNYLWSVIDVLSVQMYSIGNALVWKFLTKLDASTRLNCINQILPRFLAVKCIQVRLIGDQVSNKEKK